MELNSMLENMVETSICNSKKTKIFLAHFFNKHNIVLPFFGFQHMKMHLNDCFATI